MLGQSAPTPGPDSPRKATTHGEPVPPARPPAERGRRPPSFGLGTTAHHGATVRRDGPAIVGRVGRPIAGPQRGGLEPLPGSPLGDLPGSDGADLEPLRPG